jgi:hypothetical protein
MRSDVPGRSPSLSKTLLRRSGSVFPLLGCVLWMAAACDSDRTSPAHTTDVSTDDAAAPDAMADTDAAQPTDTTDTTNATDSALDTEPAPADPWLEELAELGLTSWIDDGPLPALVSDEAGVRVYAFDTDQGPLCLRGEPFRFSTRTTDSPNLLVFLQGGGACWSEFCLAVRRAPAGIPNVDALRQDLAANPLRDWNVVYLPYCDGSLFAGDRDHDDDGDGAPDRFHRGLHNLAGALRTARIDFPAPERVVLTGSSAGGFGTIIAVLLVRIAWPGVPIDVINDSGVGIARPGDRAFLATLLDEFNVDRWIPASCEGCIDDGHIAPLIGWTLDRDPDVRVAVFSSWYDSIIASTFLQIDDELFAQTLDAQTSALHAAHPDRYRRFFVDGITHTTMLGDPTGIIGSDIRAVELPPGFLNQLSSIEIGSMETTAIGERRFSDWIRDFVEASDAWTDTVEPRTPRAPSAP